MLRNDFGKLRIIAVDAKCMYCFTYCNVPQSKRSLWGYLWWWEENLKTSQYFVNIAAVRRQHGKVRGWRRQGIRNQREQRDCLRGVSEGKLWWREEVVSVSLDLRLSWHKIGASSFLAPGSESVYTTPPFQIGRHPTHERHIGLPGPVNHVFSILSNIIHTAFESSQKQWICLQPFVMSLPCIREALKNWYFLGIF